ncbi:hypothetical protein EIN_056480 [Entamoeba invadens IP1]|uniref:hypothetical protein n=1 Tax=Entamoeba invadens IP1 TaxID=370355 RepID=UPI0002C3ED5E|nr:hypothetical protein EIN_056480 [Entamoeba invadens IP1]ELP93273.1 hypothetical protein EIN_056480 [Entamoeba invadens IP1]|eukprot:XP_004260044.1 hypothetical protein EIN_056480 [Entamoeba invadens IP1]
MTDQVESLCQLLKSGDSETEALKGKILEEIPKITFKLSQRTTFFATKAMLRSTHLLEFVAVFLDNNQDDTLSLLLQSAYYFKRYPITRDFRTIEKRELTDLQFKRLRRLQELLYETQLKNLALLTVAQLLNKFLVIFSHTEILMSILIAIRVVQKDEIIPPKVAEKLFLEYFVNEVSEDVGIEMTSSNYPTEEWLETDEIPKECLPILTDTYIDLYDYVKRNYILYRKEAFDAACEDMVTSLQQIGIAKSKDSIRVKRYGKRTLPIISFETTFVGGENISGGERDVLGEVTVNPVDAAEIDGKKEKWEFVLHEIVFLVSFEENGKVKKVRGGEILKICDLEGRDEAQGKLKGSGRKLQVKMDGNQYEKDQKKEFGEYHFDVLISRDKEVGTFKKTIENVKEIMKKKKFGEISQQMSDVLLGIKNKPTVVNEQIKSIQMEEESRQTNTEGSKDKVETSNEGITHETNPSFTAIMSGQFPWNPEQKEVLNGFISGESMKVTGKERTGKSSLVTQMAISAYSQKKRVLVVTHSNLCLNNFVQGLVRSGVYDGKIVRLGHGNQELFESSKIDFSKRGRVEKALQERQSLLTYLQSIAEKVGLPQQNFQSLQLSLQFIKSLKEQTAEKSGVTDEQLSEIEKEVKLLLPLEIFRSQKQKENYIMNKFCQIVAMTSTFVSIQFNDIDQHFDLVIIDEAGTMLELEMGLLVMLMGIHGTKQIIAVGNESDIPSVIHDKETSEYTRLNKGLFHRMCNVKTIDLKTSYNL